MDLFALSAADGNNDQAGWNRCPHSAYSACQYGQRFVSQPVTDDQR
jgi:hypothetical protein